MTHQKRKIEWKKTSPPCATHTQLISWTVWQQSNSETEQQTTAIKFQFAPTPLTCFLSATCTSLLRALLQMSDRGKGTYCGAGSLKSKHTVHNLCKNTLSHKRTDCGHSEGQGPLNHQCAAYFFCNWVLRKESDQQWVQLLQHDTCIIILITSLEKKALTEEKQY